MKTLCQDLINCRVLCALLFLVIVGQVSPVVAAPAKKCTYDNFDKKCKKVKAEKLAKVSYGCKARYKGKALYKKGKYSCGVCPKGYARNPIAKKKGGKACVAIGYLKAKKDFKNAETPKQKEYARSQMRKLFLHRSLTPVMASKCRPRDFKHKGYCKSCPDGTKRMHIAGLDNGYCKVLKKKKK